MRTILVAVAFLVLSQVPAQAQVRVDRLEKIAKYLETKVKPENFTYGTWGSNDDPDDPNYLGCVGGHATRAFADSRLYLTRLQSSWFMNLVFESEQGRLSGQGAACAFFGVSASDGRYLFLNTGKDTVEEAVAKIREVISREKLAQVLASL